MHIEDRQLIAFLEDAGISKKKDLEAIQEQAKKQGKRFADALVQQGIVKQEQLAKLSAYILGIPYVDLSQEKVDQKILQIIPEAIARKNQIVAFRKTGDNLEVAMIDPEDLQTMDFIHKKAGLRILPRLTTSESIKHVLSQYEESLETEFGELVKKQEEEKPLEMVPEGRKAEALVGDLHKYAEELPVIRIVDSILQHAIIQNASDIHIEPTDKEVIVRYRIDGLLHDAMTLPHQVQLGLIARIKVLANLKLDEHRLPQDGRFTIQSEEYRVSFRVSILPVYDGEKAVLRVLRENVKGLTLEASGLEGKALARVQHALKKTIGMVLVTGPTGSGKTTTLYTMIDIVNKPTVNISTIEDPIEYRMNRINQTQVRPDIGLSFADGLRSLVRQDPDILMVGEIRDAETANLAINASLTGHLVLSTLHTNSASGALPRLIDMGQEPFLIASTVNVIVGQRLVRRLFSSKEKYTLSKEEVKALAQDVDTEKILALLKKEKVVQAGATLETIPFYRPKPSSEAPDGYKGRVGIFEVLEMSEEIRALVMKHSSSDEVEGEAREQGMYTMIEDGFMKVARGVTSIEEVLRVTRE